MAFAVIPKRVFKHNNKKSISLFFLFSKIAIHTKQWWQMKVVQQSLEASYVFGLA